MSKAKLIMEKEDIKRILMRIAHEIVEKNRGVENLVLVGIRRRGIDLAKRLASFIQRENKVEIPVGELDIGLYRDDLDLPGVQPIVAASNIPLDITGKNVILVDDVLFTSRTIRAALDALTDLGRPRCIQLAVLVDRGHRELPIHANYIGRTISTTREEKVIVKLREVDQEEGIWIE